MIAFTDPAEAGKLICCPAITVPLEGVPLDPDLLRFVPDYEAAPRRRFWARVRWRLLRWP